MYPMLQEWEYICCILVLVHCVLILGQEPNVFSICNRCTALYL